MSEYELRQNIEEQLTIIHYLVLQLGGEVDVPKRVIQDKLYGCNRLETYDAPMKDALTIIALQRSCYTEEENKLFHEAGIDIQKLELKLCKYDLDKLLEKL